MYIKSYLFSLVFLTSTDHIKHRKCLFLSIQLPIGILIFRSLCTWCFHRKNLLPSEVKESHFFLLCLVWLYSFLAKTPPFFFFFQSNRSKTLTRLACYAGRTVFFPPRSLHFLFSSHGRSKKIVTVNSY